MLLKDWPKSDSLKWIRRWSKVGIANTMATQANKDDNLASPSAGEAGNALPAKAIT